MGEDVKRPLRGPGLSPACLQGKKGLLSKRAYEFACECTRVWCSLIGNIAPPSPVLVSTVSDAVEAILGQFSSSRTVVQKVSQCWSRITAEETRTYPLIILFLMFSSILVPHVFCLSFPLPVIFSLTCPSTALVPDFIGGQHHKSSPGPAGAAVPLPCPAQLVD